jgi:membrane-anchored mycosin MYCP
MSATEVMERVNRTAHTLAAGPNAATGYGVIDPIAALTYEVPPTDQMPAPLAGHAIAGPPEQDPGSRRARNIVLIVLGACMALAAVAFAVIKSPAGN